MVCKYAFLTAADISAILKKNCKYVMTSNPENGNIFLFPGKSPDGHHIMRSAQYLHRELPIRISHRINGFRNLPFIVGCNPTILAVHELYIRSFHILNDFPEIKTKEDEERYSEVLKNLLDDHKDVVSQLAQGFKECKKHIEVSESLDLHLVKSANAGLDQ